MIKKLGGIAQAEKLKLLVRRAADFEIRDHPLFLKTMIQKKQLGLCS